jgi:hypothetical protein
LDEINPNNLAALGMWLWSVQKASRESVDTAVIVSGDVSARDDGVFTYKN